MLKIRDDIDLKKLEKYGFEKEEYIGEINIKKWFDYQHMDNNNNFINPPKINRDKIDRVYYSYDGKANIYITEFDKQYYECYQDKERQIKGSDEWETKSFEILYDLIKDGLVEKIGD